MLVHEQGDKLKHKLKDKLKHDLSVCHPLCMDGGRVAALHSSKISLLYVVCFCSSWLFVVVLSVLQEDTNQTFEFSSHPKHHCQSQMVQQ